MPKVFTDDGRVFAAGVLIMLVEDSGRPVEFLLMKHPKRWDLPKGHRDPGENDRQTALREMSEETGIRASDVKLDPTFRFQTEYEVTYKKRPGQVFQKTVTYFLATITKKPKLTLTEHEDARWFAWCPPHRIQEQTIDPLLMAVDEHFESN